MTKIEADIKMFGKLLRTHHLGINFFIVLSTKAMPK